MSTVYATPNHQSFISWEGLWTVPTSVNCWNRSKKTRRTNAGVISRKESSCIMTMQSLTQQPKRCRSSTTWAGNCSLIPLTAQTLPHQTFTCLVPWKSSREAQSLKVMMKSKLLWVTGGDFGLKIFTLRCACAPKLVHKWKKCAKLMGDYVEKKLSFYLNYNSLYWKIDLICWITLVFSKLALKRNHYSLIGL